MRKKAGRLGWGLFLFLLPFQLGKHFWPSWSLVWGIKIDYLAPTIYFYDILFFFLFLLFLPEFAAWFKKIKKKIFLLPGAVFLFLNIFLAPVPAAAALGWGRFFEAGFLLWLAASFKKETVSLLGRIVPFWLFFSGLLALAQGIKQSSLGGVFWWLGERSLTLNTPGVAKLFLGHRFWLRPYATFSHPNSLAGFLLVAMILELVLPEKVLKKKKIVRGALILGGAGLVLTLSRTALISGLFLWSLSLFLGKKRERWLIFSLFFLSLFPFFSFSWRLSLRRRLFLLLAAQKMFWASPFWGVGRNNFIPALTSFWPFRLSSQLWLQPVHNLYFLLLAETGLFGFSLFLFLLKKAWAAAGKYRWPLAAILLTGFGDHYWLTLNQNLFLLVLILGLALTNEKRN